MPIAREGVRQPDRTDYGFPPKASKQIPRRVWALRAAPWNKGADVVVTGGLADTRSYVDEVKCGLLNMIDELLIFRCFIITKKQRPGRK